MSKNPYTALATEPQDMEDMAIEEIDKQFHSTEDQIAELQKKVKQYQTVAMDAKERGDAETLSNTLVRLARVNTALGSRAAYAKYVARNAERAYKRLRSSKKLLAIDMGSAIGKAEEQAFVNNDVEAAFKIYSNVQLLADDADDMSYRTDTFMKMAQSGLSLIKNDINGRV